MDGLKAGFLNGLGKLDPADDRAEYDKKYVHTDILVIGGGPAGLAAAREAVRSGARVILMDDQPELGGSLLSGSTAPELAETIEGKPALEWVADVEAELVSGAESTVLNRTTAFGAYDANYVIAVQNRTDHLSSPAAAGVSRQRIWHIRANQVVLAPGAHERPLVFENNDRPGIMLASAVRSYLNRYAVAAGSARGHQHHQRQRLRPGRGPARRRRQGRGRRRRPSQPSLRWLPPPSKPAPGC